MLNISSSNTILYCKQWQETVHFYHEVLKFPATFRKDDWFIELRINDQSRISLADASRCTIEAGAGVGITLSWAVNELESLHANLSAQSVRVSPIAGGNKSGSWRAPYFYAYDPEGHRIEFWLC